MIAAFCSVDESRSRRLPPPRRPLRPRWDVVAESRARARPQVGTAPLETPPGGVRDGNHGHFPAPARELSLAPKPGTPPAPESRLLGRRNGGVSGLGEPFRGALARSRPTASLESPSPPRSRSSGAGVEQRTITRWNAGASSPSATPCSFSEPGVGQRRCQTRGRSTDRWRFMCSARLERDDPASGSSDREIDKRSDRWTWRFACRFDEARNGCDFAVFRYFSDTVRTPNTPDGEVSNPRNSPKTTNRGRKRQVNRKPIAK